MRHRVVASVGLVLFALIVVGFVMRVAMAWQNNRPFVGVNYQGLPIGTYSTTAILVGIALIGLFMAIRYLFKKVRRLLSKEN